jgi:hypothetical protein
MMSSGNRCQGAKPAVSVASRCQLDTIARTNMPHLPHIADRLWHAYYCLPRKESGELPSLRELSEEHEISVGTLSRAIRGDRIPQTRTVYRKLSAAFRVTEHWIEFGGADAPRCKYAVPPRPGLVLKFHGEIPGWTDSVNACIHEAIKRGFERLPPEAFIAGAELPVYRHIDRITPERAIGAAKYAWETATEAEQTFYSTLEASRASVREKTPRSSGLRRSSVAAKGKGYQQ